MFLDTFCSFTEGYGNGKKKIPVAGRMNFEDCADYCFKLKREGNEAINGATLEGSKCFCEMNQTRTWFSKEKMNCHFLTKKKEEGNYLSIFILIHLTGWQD